MLNVFTIVLNGQPFIERHHLQLQQLSLPWRWTICEGPSKAIKDTAHCTTLTADWYEPDGRSVDGTAEYLDMLEQEDSRCTVLRESMWEGKTAQCNAALATFDRAGVLMQIDSDELWTASQLATVYSVLKNSATHNAATFWCRYYVGADLVLSTIPGYANNPAYEWRRAWQFQPGDLFKTHEPPVLQGKEKYLPQDTMARLGCVFDHASYCTLEQMEMKAAFYSHMPNLLDNWQRMQSALPPFDLKFYLPCCYTSSQVIRTQNILDQ